MEQIISFFKKEIENGLNIKKNILDNQVLLNNLLSASQIIIKALKEKKQVFFCGNGGSAADAQHLAAELSGRFYFDRPPLNAEVLGANFSYLTAVANDYSYAEIFSRAIKGKGSEGDVLIGFSTSGNSKNVLLAFEAAKEMGIKTIAFTGETGGAMKQISDILINVPSTDTARIQESHIHLGHMMCAVVEQELFGKGSH